MATVVEFLVKVYDGECIPVADLEIGARFAYPDAPSTWSRSVTDGDGCAAFREAHHEPPEGVDLFVGGAMSEHFAVQHGATLILEV